MLETLRKPYKAGKLAGFAALLSIAVLAGMLPFRCGCSGCECVLGSPIQAPTHTWDKHGVLRLAHLEQFLIVDDVVFPPPMVHA